MEPTKRLPLSALRNLADYSRSTYFYEAPADITLDNIMHPPFWAHHVVGGKQLKRNDKIEIVAADGSFDVEVRVVETGQGFAKMRMLRQWVSDAVVAKAEPLSGDIVEVGDRRFALAGTTEMLNSKPVPRVDWGGPAHKWRVIGLDGEPAKTGFGAKEDAFKALREYATSAGIPKAA